MGQSSWEDRTADRADRLLERDPEQELLDQAVVSAQVGRGRLVIVEGEAGIGKSRLLRTARARARTANMAVLAAAGLELEGGFAFGLARRLFERVLEESDVEQRERLLAGAAAPARELFDGRVATGAARGADHGYAIVHGLRALTVNLLAAGPLLMLVDDAQWADSPSLRFLAHLAADLDTRALMVVIAARTGTPETPSELAEGIMGAPGAQVLRLRPLSPDAVEQVVRRTFADATPEFSQACSRTTGGNPFYLHELLELARVDGLSPIDQVDVDALVPESVMHSVLLRLARLPDPAPALASAAAVLGDGASLRHAATLAGLDEEVAEATADTLAAARILRPGDPLVFTHPLIGAAVHADLPALARSRAHRRAAALVEADDGPVETVAAHLVACRPERDAHVVDVLLRAAQQASARGGHRAASHLLQRALAEPPLPDQRMDVTVDLALAEAATGTSEAGPHLLEALDLVDDRTRRIASLRALARLLFARSDFDGAADAIDQAFQEVDPDHPAASELIVDSLAIASSGPSPRPDAASYLTNLLDAAALDGELPAEPGLRALLAGAMLATGRPAADVSRAARAALAGLPADDGFYGIVTGSAVVPLVSVGDLDAAGPAIDRALAGARHGGSLIAAGTASHWRAALAYHTGDLGAAVADAEATLEICRAGWDMCAGWVAPLLAHAHMDRGDLDAAEDAVRLGEKISDQRPEWALTLEARGRLALLRDDPAAAWADLVGAGRHAERFGITQPTILPWRSSAALASIALGDTTRARQLADTELDAAEAIGAPRTLGVALRVAGRAHGGSRGIELLRRSVHVLEGSPARLEHARSLVALGAALRRAGGPSASREPLRRGLELARSLGAEPLANEAADELRAAGGRRRLPRPATHDATSLTPAETRIARLAAQGLSSPQIAQTLFVARKTVDWHLGHAFRKLGVTSRHQLAGVLAPQPSEDRATV